MTSNLIIRNINIIKYSLFGLLPFLIYLFNEDIFRNYLHFSYFTILLFAFLLLQPLKNTFYLTSISFLLLCYVLISFAFGSWSFSEGYVLNKRDLQDFINFQNYKHSNFFIFMCCYIIIFLEFFFKEKYFLSAIEYNQSKSVVNITSFFLPIGVIIIFSIVSIDASYIGGGGSLSYIPQALATIIIISLIQNYNFKIRLPVYLLIILFFSAISFMSKREALILFLPMFFYEIRRISEIRFSRFILFSIIFLLLVLIIVIVMSIMRGYGGYLDINSDFFLTLSSMIDSILFIKDYFYSPDFIGVLFNNFEFSYTFFHSIQAIEYVINDPKVLEYGSTFFKFIYVFIPRELFEKPDSILHLYAAYRDPTYRSIGGSWPINIFAEFFWNFGWLSIFFMPLSFMLINKYYSFILRQSSQYHYENSWLLLIYILFPIFFRGSGLDQFFAYIIVGLFFSFLLFVLNRTFASRSIF